MIGATDRKVPVHVPFSVVQQAREWHEKNGLGWRRIQRRLELDGIFVSEGTLIHWLDYTNRRTR